MRIMRKFFVFLVLNFCALAAGAGPEIESFRQDIAALTAAQEKNPNRIIRYADKDGALARAVLNPARAMRLLAEGGEEINAAETMKSTLNMLTPVARHYQLAFNQLPGKYDEEYLDSFELTYTLLLNSMLKLQAIDVDEVKDENTRKMIVAVRDRVKSLPPVLLQGVQKQLDQGKFSSSFRPQAQARLDQLKSRTETSMAAQAAPAPAQPAVK